MRKVLVLSGDGINSEQELGRSFAEHGAQVKHLHVNELLKTPKQLQDFQLLALPGGFSFGDELRSGKILAEKLRSILSDALNDFLAQDGRILGICNGFQVLAQLGAFDWGRARRSFTLAENNHGKFMDKWVGLQIRPEAQQLSPWFKQLEGELFLPVRHREGRIVLNQETSVPLMPLSYSEDINGSFEQAAAVLSADGRVLGMMPHPEVATKSFLHPFKMGAEANARKVSQLFLNGLN
jgi:phosphoribosylformylglycinamidine synthase subunit PurQ / glutaminase